MPEMIFSGPAGRIEARYHHSKAAGSPIAILLHPHPTFGGTMNNPIVHAMYQMFQSRGFSVLRPQPGDLRKRRGRAFGRSLGA